MGWSGGHLSTTRPRVVVDCRWIGLGGVGRQTELLIRGIRERPGLCNWVLWGNQRYAHLAGDAVEWVDERSDPRRRFGQMGRRRIPRGDVTVFMCQTRPLATRGPSVVVIHDTIQVAFAQSRMSRALRHWYLRRSARSADVVMAVSTWSRDDIIQTLDVDPGRISILHARGLRRPADLSVQTGRRGDLLYVGSFAHHKNVPFLIRAFGRTQYAQTGGTLRLVGGDGGETVALQRQMLLPEQGRVYFAGRVSDAELDDAYRQADAVVQPSLAEGFGLPPREAILRGLPLCHSGRGAMSDITGDDIWVFDPTDEASAAGAIDAAIATGQRDHGWARWRRSMRAGPTGDAGAMADDVAEAARRALVGER